jgi:enediyne biosynthesis protein E4
VLPDKEMKMRNAIVLAMLWPGAVLATETATETDVPPAPVVPLYADETATSGFTSRFEGEWEFMVGGGVATFDCNGDLYPDAFFAGGSAPAQMYVNTSLRGEALTFARTESGLEVDGATGAYPLDVDSDGVMDLLVLRVGPNMLMRGTGDCRFEPAPAAWGFDPGDDWSTAAAATWEDGRAFPTIAIGNYIDRRETAFPWGSCTANTLQRGGAGRLETPLPLTPSHCSLGMMFSDWNRSGRPDLRVTNDREYYKGGSDQLWAMDETPRLYTADDGWKRLRIWGMGIATADLNGDTYPEYFMTSMADNRLQMLDAPGPGAKPAYGEQAFPRGIHAQRPYTGGDIRPSTAWHTQFEDVNNDGLVDLYIVKGNVAKMPDFAADDPNNLLLQRADGTFEEAGDRAGVASMRMGRGGAVVDLNLDGALDIIATNRWTGAEVWRNTNAGLGQAVQVALRQPAPNVGAVNAWIEWRTDGGLTHQREVLVGGGHAGGHAGLWHLGLAGAAAAEVRVIWPDGTEGPWQAVDAGGMYVLERDRDPAPVTPPR